VCEKAVDALRKKGCVSMANIRENTKNGKVVSYRFTACMERDVRGKQVRKYTTWTPSEGLTPAKARKAAERAADAWEQEVRAEYQKEKKLISYIFCFMEVFTMRFIIDTNLERVIVPDSFFNQIDKMNQVLVENGAGDKKIDYVQYIKDAMAKAIENAPVRKGDVKSLK